MENISIWLSEYGIDWGIKIATAIAIFVIGKFIARMISRLLQKALQHSGTDAMLTGFLGNIAYGIILVAVVLAAIDSLGVNVTSLLASAPFAASVEQLVANQRLQQIHRPSPFTAGMQLVGPKLIELQLIP